MTPHYTASPRTLAAPGDAFVREAMKFEELTGETFGKAANNAFDLFALLRLGLSPEADAARTALTEERDNIKRARLAKDTDSVLAQVKKGTKKLSLADDGLVEACDALEAQERLIAAVNAGIASMRRQCVTVMRQSNAIDVIREVYAKVVGWEPDASTTYGEVISHDKNSAEIITSCKDLAAHLEGRREWSKQERKTLIRQFAALPSVMPSYASVRAELDGLAAETPLAIAQVEAAASKKAQKVEDRIYAQAAAKARLGSKDSE